MEQCIKSTAASRVAGWMLAVTLCACAAPQPAPSLYDRLGGLPVITALVDKAVDRHVADPRTRRSFEGVDLKALKASIVSQACEATGGPCKYKGKPMDKAHEGLDITPEEFEVATSHIALTLDELHVGKREKEEVLAILRPMEKDIVGR